MNAEIVSVGTELLLGDIANTDAQFISQRLAEIGINVFYHTVVGDNPGRLKDVISLASKRSDLIITTGGLGPTYDDLTKEVICQTFGLSLVLHEPSLERIRSFFASRGKEMTENNTKQAYLPENCTVLENDWGTAPGCAVRAGNTTLIMLPGPPRECQPMVTERMIPYLKQQADHVIRSHVMRIFGMGESAVEALLREKMEHAQNPTVAPYCKDGEVLLRITAAAPTEEAADDLIAPKILELREILGETVYGVDVDSLEETVLSLLRERKMTLAVAESCTGGLLGKRLTDVAGSSEVFLGGVISYANQVKADLLGVPEQILARHGAVSIPVAAYMARGAARCTGADCALALTGIAGPGGGSEEKPVGLVYVGLYFKGVVTVKEFRLGGRNRDRAYIRWLAASHALELLRHALLRTAPEVLA